MLELLPDPGQPAELPEVEPKKNPREMKRRGSGEPLEPAELTPRAAAAFRSNSRRTLPERGEKVLKMIHNQI